MIEVAVRAISLQLLIFLMAMMIALNDRAHRAELIIVPHGSMAMNCSTFMYC